MGTLDFAMVSTSRRAPPAPTFDVPDLDLGPPLPPARTPAVRSTATRPRSGSHQIGTRGRSPAGAEADLELDLELAGSLELESEAPFARTQRHQPAPGYGTLASLDDDFALDEVVAVEPVDAPVDTRPWPRGRANDAKPSSVTPEEIAECAAYGRGTAFYLAPAYAWRVWNRKHELARLLRFRQDELATREAERDRLLVDLTLSLTEQLEKQDRFQALLAELSEAKRALEGQEQTLATTNSTVSQVIGVHDADLNRLESERGERAKVVEKLRRERDARAADHQRTSAKLKRVRIELRNATEKARAIVGPDGGAMPAALARLHSELSGTEATLEAELKGCEAPVAAASLALEEGEQPLFDIERQIAAVRAERALTVRNTQQQVEQEVSRTRSAKASYVGVAKRIAFAVLDLKGAIPVDRILLDRVQGADDRVEAHEREVEKLTLALGAYDHGTYALGIKLALAPFVFALAYLLLRGFL